MNLYYTQLLPTELQELLILFVGIDIDTLDNLCKFVMVNVKLCSNGNLIWKRMFATHITSKNLLDYQNHQSRIQYNSLIISVFNNIKNTDYNQKMLLILIKDYSADLLLIELLQKYPNILNKVRENLLRNLMTRFVLGKITKMDYIDEIEFPVEFMPILLKNNDREAAEVLASVIQWQRYNILLFKREKQMHQLIELLLPKIPIDSFTAKSMELDDDWLEVLDNLKITHYFE